MVYKKFNGKKGMSMWGMVIGGIFAVILITGGTGIWTKAQASVNRGIDYGTCGADDFDLDKISNDGDPCPCVFNGKEIDKIQAYELKDGWPKGEKLFKETAKSITIHDYNLILKALKNRANAGEAVRLDITLATDYLYEDLHNDILSTFSSGIDPKKFCGDDVHCNPDLAGKEFSTLYFGASKNQVCPQSEEEREFIALMEKDMTCDEIIIKKCELKRLNEK